MILYEKAGADINDHFDVNVVQHNEGIKMGGKQRTELYDQSINLKWL